MQTNNSIDVTIIGAGLTGLTLAHLLTLEGKKVRILEKSELAGGVIQTQNIDGFIVESGPNTGVASNFEITRLFESLAGKCEIELANNDSKYRWIWKNKNWMKLPSGPISAISTSLFTWKDKFRILAEPFRKKGSDPNENIADLVKRRLGKSFLDFAVDPFISGVYAGDPEFLVTRFALPRLYNLEQTYGSFIRGAMAKKKEAKKSNEIKKYKGVFSVKGGLSKLIHTLQESIGTENIWLNSPLTEVNFKENEFVVNTHYANQTHEWRSKQVVITCGSKNYSSLLKNISAENYSAITNLEYAKIIQVAVGYKNWQGIPLKAFGGLIPSVENRKILGILFPSSIFKGRSPENGALLSVFLGGFRHPEIFELNDSQIEKLVLNELMATLKVPYTLPNVFKIFRYEAAIPQYGLSSELRYKQIQTLQTQFPGLYLAGNIRDGIGMADRIAQAYKIAEQICI